MISEKQYKKALAIVQEYRKQLSLSVVSGCFSLSDLTEMSGSIQVRKLTDKLVDDSFAAWLEEELYVKGHTAKWVSLDDLGFISISFSDGNVTDERMSLVVSILNNR